MPKVRFTRTFAAAHRIATDPGKCSNIHGHNYRARIIVTGNALDSSGFVVPFDYVKEILDSLDHALILDRDDPLVTVINDSVTPGVLRLYLTDGPPSTEHLAEHLARRILEACQASPAYQPVGSVHVRLRETPGIEAEARIIG